MAVAENMDDRFDLQTVAADICMFSGMTPENNLLVEGVIRHFIQWEGRNPNWDLGYLERSKYDDDVPGAALLNQPVQHMINAVVNHRERRRDLDL